MVGVIIPIYKWKNRGYSGCDEHPGVSSAKASALHLHHCCFLTEQHNAQKSSLQTVMVVHVGDRKSWGHFPDYPENRVNDFYSEHFKDITAPLVIYKRPKDILLWHPEAPVTAEFIFRSWSTNGQSRFSLLCVQILSWLIHLKEKEEV